MPGDNNDAAVIAAYTAAAEQLAQLYLAVSESDFANHAEIQGMAFALSICFAAFAETISDHLTTVDVELVAISIEDLLDVMQHAQDVSSQN